MVSPAPAAAIALPMFSRMGQGTLSGESEYGTRRCGCGRRGVNSCPVTIEVRGAAPGVVVRECVRDVLTRGTSVGARARVGT